MSSPLDPEAFLARVFRLAPDDDEAFQALHRQARAYQRLMNPVMSRFDGAALPADAFKLADVCTFPPEEAKRVFRSSGTGSGSRARHLVRDETVFERAGLGSFDHLVGAVPGAFRILGHLPAYADDSSLVFMVDLLCRRRGLPGSGLFLDDQTLFKDSLTMRNPVLLFGAAFGLLDLGERGVEPLPEGSVIIETGGMKTRRREMGRADLHDRLGRLFGVPPDAIMTEYGMCEMTSSCYGTDRLRTPPWVRVRAVSPDDGERPLGRGVRGQLAVTDLASIHSCVDVLTQDAGTCYDDGFEVHGRLQGADLRGCNFLLEET